MVKINYYLILIFLCFTGYIFPQVELDQSETHHGRIDQEQNKLSEIKDEITALENEIKSKTQKEKETFEVLENYNKQSYLLNKVINQLRSEEKEKQKKINKSIEEIKILEKQISILKENYSKYITAIYKYGKTSELASLFDSESFEQALLRYEYLKKFSEKRKEDLADLENGIKKLSDLKIVLEKERLEKKHLADQKQNEENGLGSKLKERKKILSAIKNDKEELKKELDAKKTAEAKINQFIVKLIADEERKRSERENLAEEGNELVNLTPVENSEDKFNYDLSISNLSSFSDLKGRLGWPISDGKIIRQFGKNTNDDLNTVTLNYGVDIKTDSDTDVRAVAEGVISIIDWIPGYGSVIIITHKDDYRTVYSHLSQIYVGEGDQVSAGKIIAKVGESLEGNVLHFEIWNSRNNQNPEVWLVKK